MTTNNSTAQPQAPEIVITESAIKKVMDTDQTFKLKCIVESLYDELQAIKQQLATCGCQKEKKDAKTKN